MAEKLARVQDEEAKAARREGRSYIPESTLGQGTSVKQPEAPAPVAEGPGPSGYVQYGARGREVTGNQIQTDRSEEHTSELQSLMRISYAVFCLKKKKSKTHNTMHHNIIRGSTTQNHRLHNMT